MMLILKFAVVALCLLMATFCAFGFLASFEPGARGTILFRFAYGSLGLACAGAIVSVLASTFRSGSK